MREPNVTKEYRYALNKKEEYIRTYYNLEVVIFLSFRIQSLYTKAFREWVLNAFCEYGKEATEPEVIILFNTNTRKSTLNMPN
ncbi:conserved hypothetical protein [uncultured Dysgonomonas sp.]|uniref:Uncharacterized protein n=1 Tax=uncultured Dysgonomonas sp. TaxID=206096 RepID=A0A212J261_9BACT|nr:conserved hypothetical protein [uncultured Dysgonomonas sp.]